MFNSFGNIFRLTSFGESHGKGVGGVIDGFPAGIVIDEEFVQQEIAKIEHPTVDLEPYAKEEDLFSKDYNELELDSGGIRIESTIQLNHQRRRHGTLPYTRGFAGSDAGI